MVGNFKRIGDLNETTLGEDVGSKTRKKRGVWTASECRYLSEDEWEASDSNMTRLRQGPRWGSPFRCVS